MNGKELCIFILTNHMLDDDIETILDKAFVSVEQIAEHFKVACPTVRAWIELGKIKGVKLGETYYVQRDEYERVVKDGVK